MSQTSIQDRQTRKSPKISKKVAKCFQLVLLCQKLLRPFSSSTKDSQKDGIRESHLKEKSKSIQEICCLNRLTMETTALRSAMFDASVQTNLESMPSINKIVLKDDFDINHGSGDFPYDIDDSVKDQYWDLDIDSAIVGDFNSMSAFSLDEEADPNYATIKVSPDGQVLDTPPRLMKHAFVPIYSDEKTSCANSSASSPKSGIYSKIMKPRRNDDFDYQVTDYYRPQTGARLNFEKIMAIRGQLGLSRYYHPNSDCSVSTNDRIYPNDTPDIPRRSYGSSVINYITELRENGSQGRSCRDTTCDTKTGTVQQPGNLYSPIWPSMSSPRSRTSRDHDAPASVPIAPKRSINRIVHQLNPIYHDDSSEGASSTSINSPSRVLYPQIFSDKLSKKSTLCDNDRRSYATIFTEDVNWFRHMDSDVNLVYTDCPYQSDTVPSDFMVGDVLFFCDDKLFLQPLMERSCEDDYFRRDILSSLDSSDV